MSIRLVLNAQVRHDRKQWSEQEELTFVRKRQALDIRIEKHRDGAQRYLPPQVMDPISSPDPNHLDNDWIDDADVEVDEEESVAIDLAQLKISVSDGMVLQKKAIYLPSIIGYETCEALGLKDLVKSELSLRQGQANDAMEAIRIGIGEKSFRFRDQLRTSKAKVQKTRSWAAIHTVDRQLKLNCSIYKQARQAMIGLGAPKAILDRYQVLTSDDLHTNTAVQEPNARGQRNKELSWIWKMPGASPTDQATLLHECEMFSIYWVIPGLNHLPVYRVSWIRAKSRHERWREELSISSHEMVWVPLWFQHRAREWKDRATKPGVEALAAYAYRQAANWDEMKQVALMRFEEANPEIVKVFGYSNINKS
jgi:hypothetical protein